MDKGEKGGRGFPGPTRVCPTDCCILLDYKHYKLTIQCQSGNILSFNLIKWTSWNTSNSK